MTCRYPDLGREREAVEKFGLLARRFSVHALAEEALCAQFETLLRLDEDERSLETAARFVREYPSSKHVPAALSAKAWALKNLLRATEAISAYKALLRRFPKGGRAPEAHFWLGVLLEERKKPANAAAHYREVIESFPESVYAEHAQYRLANCLYERGEAKEAAEVFTKFLRRRPESPLIEAALYGLAWAHHDLKEPHGERAAWRRLLERFPSGPYSFDASFALGELAFSEEDYEEAAAYYRRALSYTSGEGADAALYKLAWSLKKLRRESEAAETFEEVHTRHPSGRFAADSMLNCGRYFLAKGRHAEAAVLFEKLVSSHPATESSREAAFDLAECHLKQGKWKKALDRYKESVGHLQGGDLRRAAYGMGVALLNLGATADAADQFRKAVGRGEDKLAAMSQLGLGDCAFRERDFEKASRSYYQVVLLYGFEELHGVARYKAGRSFEALGETERAKKFYRDVLRHHPNSEHAPRSEERLKALGGE